MVGGPGSAATPLVSRAGARLEQVAFRPETLPADAVLAVALLPPVAAGLLLFGRPALAMLAVAAGVAGSVHLAALLLRRPPVASPVGAALVAVALCGPGAPLVWSLAVVLAATALELLRGRLLPRAGVHAGLLAYASLFLATGGAMAAYVRPAGMLRFPEPVQQWARFYGGANSFLDPATLYVGNVAGPVFATSLLAVVVSVAWLWYARRLSLSVLAGFGLGAAAVSAGNHWDLVFQLDSGPAWFAAGLVLADRRLLPAAAFARPLAGLAAGVLGYGLRSGNFYVEGVFLAIAAVQVSMALAEGVVTLPGRLARPRPESGPQARKEPASA